MSEDGVKSLLKDKEESLYNKEKSLFKKEIGSFIELGFKKNLEYYNGNDIARLNSGRAAIYHSLKVLGCNKVYLPYYQCETVRKFLVRKGIEIRYYFINSNFEPILEEVPTDYAVIIVNYYGIMSRERMRLLREKYNNVIIDNAQGFFFQPMDGCMNVYSPRKFIGVPDGSYVIGKNAINDTKDYDEDFSSGTSLFLLQRIEYGLEGIAYESRKQNEDRIDNSDIKLMSKLTRTILDGTDYKDIITKRKENFAIARRLFDKVNLLTLSNLVDIECVPMVYPLIIDKEGLIEKLIDEKIFQGRWWSYLLNEMKKDTFEYYVSKNLVPITIDQRYNYDDIQFMFLKCKEFLKD